MKAQDFLEKPFIELQEVVDAMNTRERDELRQEMESISRRAGQVAGYLDERYGSGCGDQGHKKAVKQFNRNGKMIWMKVFGYNGYHDMSF